MALCRPDIIVWALNLWNHCRSKAAADPASRGIVARTWTCRHVQPKRFKPGQPLDLELSIEKPAGSVRLYYRHVNHAERYESVEMRHTENSYHVSIPADYTDSPYPLQYYFELKEEPGTAWLYPGFTSELTNQPYSIVREKV